MKQHFNQKKNEEPGVSFEGPIYEAVVVNVIQSGWESGFKVSIWVEDINTSAECIMGYRPQDRSALQRIIDEVLSMKTQWLYRIENFTTREFGNVSPMQIELTENSRIIPMPNDLNIKIPFNPKRITDNVRHGQGIDVEGKLIKVFATEWSSTITLKIRNEFDQYFMVDCPRSKSTDKNFAKSKCMKTVLLRNCQYDLYDANLRNHHVTKKFDALRFEA